MRCPTRDNAPSRLGRCAVPAGAMRCPSRDGVLSRLGRCSVPPGTMRCPAWDGALSRLGRCFVPLGTACCPRQGGAPSRVGRWDVPAGTARSPSWDGPFPMSSYGCNRWRSSSTERLASMIASWRGEPEYQLPRWCGPTHGGRVASVAATSDVAPCHPGMPQPHAGRRRALQPDRAPPAAPAGPCWRQPLRGDLRLAHGTDHRVDAARRVDRGRRGQPDRRDVPRYDRCAAGRAMADAAAMSHQRREQPDAGLRGERTSRAVDGPASGLAHHRGGQPAVRVGRCRRRNHLRRNERWTLGA